MIKPIIRLLSFFAKEVNEVRRQPRLVLSLLLGPFLILLLFGIGYQGERPTIRTALVVPEGGIGQVSVEELRTALSANFSLDYVGSDENRAMALLRTDQVDVVEILPADVEQRALRGEQTPIDFRYNEINPLNEQWIQYLAYAQVNEINKAILLKTTQGMQSESGSIKQLLGQTREQLDALQSGLSAAQQPGMQDTLGQLRESLGVLAASPLLASQAVAGQDPAQAQQQITELRDDLEALEQAITSGSLDQQRERISSVRDRVAQLEQTIGTVSQLPPQVLISPLQPAYANTYGKSLDFMTFYAPAVLALILQHIAVTLGALSLVRERLLGAIELFRVAPVSMLQVLLGKYLGYTLFVGIITAALVGLMIWPQALGVPFLGSPLIFAGLLLLLTLAALGVGFLISAWSKSDSQAVQLSMLVLLLSIFFSGFFLPLENFASPVREIGYVLPLTHGIRGFQNVMLRGLAPDDFTWLTLGTIALVTFVVVTIFTQWQFRRI